MITAPLSNLFETRYYNLENYEITNCLHVCSGSWFFTILGADQILWHVTPYTTNTMGKIQT